MVDDQNDFGTEDSAFDDFINHELDLEEDIFEAAYVRFFGQLRAEIRELAQNGDLNQWEAEIDQTHLVMIEAMMEYITPVLRERYAERLTDDEYEQVIRYVATLALYAEDQHTVSRLDPTIVQIQAKARATLEKQRLEAAAKLKPKPMPLWQKWLPDLMFAALIALVILILVNGGRSGFSRSYDEIMTAVEAQSAQIAELQAAVEALVEMR